jgi:hypothetical protein
MHAPKNEGNSASRIRKKTPEEDAGRRVLSEALEEDAALRPSDVHVAQSTGLPNRLSQSEIHSSGFLDFTRSFSDRVRISGGLERGGWSDLPWLISRGEGMASWPGRDGFQGGGLLLKTARKMFD